MRVPIERLTAILEHLLAEAHEQLTWQRSLADQLDALHCRAKRLLARVFPADELKAQRFATWLTALDPLALFRTGPGWIADVAGKLIAGPERAS